MSSLHKLAEVTITIEGLPEYTGTDDELQELVKEVEKMLDTHLIYKHIRKMCIRDFPELIDKIKILVPGLD